MVRFILVLTALTIKSKARIFQDLKKLSWRYLVWWRSQKQDLCEAQGHCQLLLSLKRIKFALISNLECTLFKKRIFDKVLKAKCKYILYKIYNFIMTNIAFYEFPT